MIRLYLKTLIFIHLLAPGILFGQTGGEVLVDLASTPKVELIEKKSNRITTLTLPFFDDFSRGIGFPYLTHWLEGGHVFTNFTYAINPLTLGVATLDAMDFNGRIHPHASVWPFSSDTLTSLPIDIHFPGDTSIYLSFWVQPGGHGNQPKPSDSLILELYDSLDSVWVSAWSASANHPDSSLRERFHLSNLHRSTASDSLHREFFNVHIQINDQRFLTRSFQFRFRNIASISENNHVPGLRGNSDHWHLDLVYLNRWRTSVDTLLDDVAIHQPLRSVLRTYESIPWAHFNQQARNEELPRVIRLGLESRNLGPDTWNVSREFAITNHSTGATTRFTADATNVYPREMIDLSRLDDSYTFQSAWQDSAMFTFTNNLSTDLNPITSHLRWNDTVRYSQKFVNYYAYDDGSAESGYGLFGEGSQNGKVAVMFKNFKPDTLRGVYIYFNQTYQNASQKYFRLGIWADSNGSPGDLIYDQFGLRPIYTDSINRFALFRLNEPLWIEAGTFYMGWMQVTADMLNVGFDLNRVNNSKLFYNIGGAWQNSRFEGTLMIRPVFGYFTENATGLNPLAKPSPLKVFPNPANEYIQVVHDGQTLGDELVSIYSVTGQLVHRVQLASGIVSIGHLPRGTYVVRLTAQNRILGTQKLAIVR